MANNRPKRPQELKKLKSVFFERDNAGIGKKKKIKLTSDHDIPSTHHPDLSLYSDICMEYEENHGLLDTTEYREKQEVLMKTWKDIRDSLKSALIIREGDSFNYNPCEACSVRESIVDVIYFHGIYIVIMMFSFSHDFMLWH
jgi:hypothetical protein